MAPARGAPLISIVIPCFNQHFFPEAIESVLEQTHPRCWRAPRHRARRPAVSGDEAPGRRPRWRAGIRAGYSALLLRVSWLGTVRPDRATGV
jgi:hypothetical protein